MWNIRILIIALFLTSFAQGQFLINPYSYAVACNPSPFFPDNAMTPSPCEVNGISGFTIDGTDYVITSETGSTTDGTYAIHIEKNTAAGTDANATLQLTGLTVGVSYTFTFEARISTPTNPNNNYVRTNALYAADWTVGNSVEIDYGAGFTTYNLTSTPAVTNPRIQIYSTTVAVNVLGTNMIIDNFRKSP